MNNPVMMWGEGEGERLDGRKEGGHSSGSFSLLAPPSASRLTQQFFSPSKGDVPVTSGGHIPEEFLRPPQQTFGAQLFGGDSQVPSVHEEIDIKPVILPPRPASPPPTPTGDTDDIDILMDDLLKDVEEDVTANPQGAPTASNPLKTQSRSIGLSIRKDIFLTPKKEVVELEDSPPSSVTQDHDYQRCQTTGQFQTTGPTGDRRRMDKLVDQEFLLHSTQAGASLISQTAAQIFQQSLGTTPNNAWGNSQNPSGKRFASHLDRQTGTQNPSHGNHIRMSNGLPGGGIMLPLSAVTGNNFRTIRTIAPKPQAPIAPNLVSLNRTNSQLTGPSGLSQTDMAVALQQLRALESHQAQKKKQEEASRRLMAAKDEANRRLLATQFTTLPGFNTNIADFLFQPEVVKEREKPKTYRRYHGNRTPLYVDPTLPPGWTRKVSQRMTGATAGGWDTYIMDPAGKRFRSKQEVRRHFEQVGESIMRWEDFDFNPFGSKGQTVGEDENIPFWEEEGDAMEAMDASEFLKTEILE